MQFRCKITLFPSFRQTNCWYSAYLRSNLLLWLRVLSLEIREKPSIIVSRGDYRAFFTFHIEIVNDTVFFRQQRQLWQQYPWHSLYKLSYKRRIKEDKKCSERLCAVAPHVMRVLFFLYASIHKNIPSCHPSLRSGTIAFAEKSSFVAEKGLCEAEKEGPGILP